MVYEVRLIRVQNSGKIHRYKVNVHGRNPRISPWNSAAESTMDFSEGEIRPVNIPQYVTYCIYTKILWSLFPYVYFILPVVYLKHFKF